MIHVIIFMLTGLRLLVNNVDESDFMTSTITSRTMDKITFFHEGTTYLRVLFESGNKFMSNYKDAERNLM